MSSTGLLPEWLSLRESADGAARAGELVEVLREYLPGDGLVVRDLGCGTGSLGRWLAGRLTGPQRWILHDREPELLALARDGMPRASLDGRPVTAMIEERDVSGLAADELAGTSLVCGSALLDLLTADELTAIAESCVAAGCAVYFTLSVVGRVELTPADPLDAQLTAAFNAHQRRTVQARRPLEPDTVTGETQGPRRVDAEAVSGEAQGPRPVGPDAVSGETRERRLLGPDAVGCAVEVFERLGATVTVADSPWRLGPADAALVASWLDGWVGAACEQQPELVADAADYRRRRLAAAAAGEVQVVVHHGDLLALPGHSDPVASAGHGGSVATAGDGGPVAMGGDGGPVAMVGRR